MNFLVDRCARCSLTGSLLGQGIKALAAREVGMAPANGTLPERAT